MAVTDVTREQFEAVMGKASWAAGAARAEGEAPADQPANLPAAASWEDAQAFCAKMSIRSADRLAIRLPTEAEWEYACRAGSERLYSYGDDASLSEAPDRAWYNANSQGHAHPVAQKKPNAWGLHDMHGNMLQWCGDWYEEYSREWRPKADPTGLPWSWC